MVYVPWLADAARTTGYRVVEVHGWRSRGHGGMRLVEGVVGHHTATPDSAPGNYPSLNVVTNGRAGLPGPLSAFGLGRDGTIYVIAAGTSWHAGASAWDGFWDLNDEFLGIEAESAGYGGWTDAQRDCYPKLVAALLRYMNRGPGRYAGHKDVCRPKGRKPDPRGIDTGWMQNTARHYLNNGMEDDVGKVTEITIPAAMEIAKAVCNYRLPADFGENSLVTRRVWQNDRSLSRRAIAEIAGLRAAVDKLADAVGQVQGVDPAAVKRAVAEAIEEAVGTVEVEFADPGDADQEVPA